MPLLGLHRRGPGIGLRPEPAAVLPLAFAGQRIRFEVQPVVPTGAALVDGDAFGRMRSAAHAAAVSPIIVSSRAVTTYTRPPSRRTGRSGLFPEMEGGRNPVELPKRCSSDRVTRNDDDRGACVPSPTREITLAVDHVERVSAPLTRRAGVQDPSRMLPTDGVPGTTDEPATLAGATSSTTLPVRQGNVSTPCRPSSTRQRSATCWRWALHVAGGVGKSAQVGPPWRVGWLDGSGRPDMFLRLTSTPAGSTRRSVQRLRCVIMM